MYFIDRVWSIINIDSSTYITLHFAEVAKYSFLWTGTASKINKKCVHTYLRAQGTGL